MIALILMPIFLAMEILLFSQRLKKRNFKILKRKIKQIKKWLKL